MDNSDDWVSYDVRKILEGLPSAEPEIIRCKGCKNYRWATEKAFGLPVKTCDYFNFDDMDEDDYCSRAERRTDERLN